jgi:glycosidase
VPRSGRGLALAAVAALTISAGSALAAHGGGEAKRKAKPPAAPAGAVLRALSQPPTRTSLASQRFYFVMPDRYANADPANDHAGVAGARDVSGFDPSQPGWFHGGDLRGLTGGCDDPQHGLARLRDLGFTAIWVTPPVRQKWVQSSSAAYHGYWGLDFEHVDPHLGTDADFAAFVDCAHRLGLKVFLDVVVNHTADVIQLSDSRYVSPEDAPWVDCNGTRFSPAAHVRAASFPCLSPARMPRTPSVPAAEAGSKSPGWLNDVTNYHDRGDIDFSSCNTACYEQGDFFGLDDLFTEKPEVSRGLAELWGGWIARYHVDGFRVDTARHVNRAFFDVWLPPLREAAARAGVTDFEVFGEVFVTNTQELSSYVRDRGVPNVLDFPMQDAAARFAGGSAGARGVAARLADDDYFTGPSGVAHTPPTFLGNHDIGHAAQQIRAQAPGASAAALLRRDQLGHALLYLLRGAPVVQWGDEFGIIGRGGDQQARQDLFPTAVEEWQTQERVGAPPIGTASYFEQPEHPVAATLRTLGRLRAEHPALSTGSTVVRRQQGSVLVVSRIDAAGRREYLAAFNGGTSAARVTVPTSTPSSAWASLLGAAQSPRSAAGGSVTIQVPALDAVLLRADAQIPARRSARPVVLARKDSLTDLAVVRATFRGTAPASVGFAVKRGSGPWTRVGLDDSPPYRAFLNRAQYRRGERVWVAAVARGYDGRSVKSPVVPFVVRR